MAIDQAELIQLRDELVRNRAKGLRSVQINGERVEFVDDAAFARRITDLNAQIAALQGQRDDPFATVYPVLGRGL
ncbi:phage head-tail joining protein [Paracoccus litorisediminis]|uniref:GpW protein n=1 Tax=Paracoccus litorisediminis TaxID=2006130 RepID=A0A844HFW1_9RHOB|nr:hypothetical protein [Paracoccus litorisediminis]MTH57649.1 hypothetical protein [Paracoccus litorisediminis]